MGKEDIVFFEVKTSRLFVARGAVSMKLRTFEGKGVKGELLTEYPISTDGSPVLVVNASPMARMMQIFSWNLLPPGS